MGKENMGNENEEPGDLESSRASQYLNKRKAILMSNNKVALPTHLQKRLTKASPFIPNSIWTAPTQEIDAEKNTYATLDFSQDSGKRSYRTPSTKSSSSSQISSAPASDLHSSSSYSSSQENNQSSLSQGSRLELIAQKWKNRCS